MTDILEKLDKAARGTSATGNVALELIELCGEAASVIRALREIADEQERVISVAYEALSRETEFPDKYSINLTRLHDWLGRQQGLDPSCLLVDISD